MKTVERAEARRLRGEEGRSVREIAALLGVSRSSASLWVRDVELTPAQHESLRQRNAAYDAQRTGSATWAAICRERRKGWQAEGRALARQGDPVHAAGCMLYWAEGDKARNTVAMSNSDPDVLGFFLRFLRAYFDVPDDRVRLRCNLFADHLDRVREIERFWLEYLGLPESSLAKPIVNAYSKYSQKKRVNRLPYGTSRLTVSDTRILQSIFGAIQEYGGFVRPGWLD